MPPTFHLFLPQMRLSFEAIVERSLAAESAGFEGMAFMDHLAPPLAFEHGMWEAMTTASWVLSRTTSLKVGHLVLCDAFRHPALLARQAVSLDHASGGRFELGIGWGSVPAELATFGVGSTAAPERVGRLAESLEIIRGLWSGETVDFKGEYFTLEGARQRPTPTGRIPITIGGVGRKTLELVRAHADWWNVPIHALDQVDRLRDRVGDARVSMQPMVAFVPTEDKRAEITELARRRFGRGKIGENLVIGGPGELIEHFGRLHAQGIERFYLWFTDFAPVDTLHQFAEVITTLTARPA